MRVLLADTTALYEEERFQTLLKSVPECRQKKALKYVRERDRALSLGAGLLLAIALKDDPRTEADAVAGAHGKLYFPGEDRLFFNLSHSGKRVMLVVSDHEVGCDVEEIVKTRDYGRIAKRVLSEEELAALGRCRSEKEKANRFYRYWTLKESFLKATGRGFSLPPATVSLRFRRSGVFAAGPEVPDDCCFQAFDFGDGYAYAVCQLGAPVPETLTPEWVDFARRSSLWNG